MNTRYSKKILATLLFVWFSLHAFTQCACLYYDTQNTLVCVMLENCSNAGRTECGEYTTSADTTACPCPRMPSMNSGCGECRGNGACWYNGTSCNPTNVCDGLKSIVLPVRLIDFYGGTQGDRNILTWSTASETNNAYFSIWNSTDGLVYHELYQLPGAGNSSHTLNYAFHHVQPTAKINYYKLIQVDFNGESEEFGPIAIDNRKVEKRIVQTMNIMGQEVDEHYKGLVIIIYNDGTHEKTYR
jgi:hypothetical protein